MKFIYFFFFLLLTSSVFGQYQVQVISGETNIAIPNATIVVMENNTKDSVKVDEHGLAVLKNAKEGDKIKVSAKDYATYEVTLGQEKFVYCPLEATSTKIEGVVVTGQIAATTAEKSIHKIRVLDRKTIDAKGATNLRDVLTDELNIRVTQDQMLGSGIQMQGSSGENVKILIDGVPVIGRLNGNVDLSQINLNNIDRIEIVEGPLSVNYGSDALAGTINLITKKTAQKGFQANVNSYNESVGNFNVDGRLAYNFGRNRFTLTGMRNFFGGWKPSDPFFNFPRSLPADTNRVTDWRPKVQYSTSLNYSYVGKRFSISPFANFYWETMTNRGMPRKPEFTVALDDIYKTKRFDQGINFSVFPTKKYRIQGVVANNYYVRDKNSFAKDLTTLKMSLVPDPAEQDTTIFNTIMSRATFSSSSDEQKIDYEVGYDVNFDRATGGRIADSSKTMGDYAVFGSMEWKAVKGFIINPAARLAYNSVFKFNVVPSLNFKYTLKDWNFRASYAKGYRAPSMKELYMDFVDINHDIHGNPNLKPEQSHNIQGWIDYRLPLKHAKFDDALSFELNGFYQLYDDKITLAQSGDGVKYYYFNLNKLETTGGKLLVSYSNRLVTAKVGTALTGIRSNFDTDKEFFYTPELNASLMYSWRKIGMTFSAFFKYTGKSTIYLETETGMDQTFISDYSMLDVDISKTFWNKHITIAIGGKNLLNVTDVRSQGTNTGAHSGNGTSSPIAWGRSVYFRLSLNFDTFNHTKSKKK